MFQFIIITLIIVLIIVCIVAALKKLIKVAFITGACLLVAVTLLFMQPLFNPATPGLSSLPTAAVEAIETYLAEQSVTPKFQGKVFCTDYFYGDDYLYGNESNEAATITYLRFHCQEFYKSGSTLSGGDVAANVAKISLKEDNKQWIITSFELAKPGILFEKSIETLLPSNISELVKNAPTVATSLEDASKSAAKEYYGIQ